MAGLFEPFNKLTLLYAGVASAALVVSMPAAAQTVVGDAAAMSAVSDNAPAEASNGADSGSSEVAATADVADADIDPQTAVPVTPNPTANADPTDEDEDKESVDDPNAIVVIGRSAAGSVVTDVPPDQVLDSETIQGYGASSIDELLDATASLTQSGRGSGRPVVLLNGRRVSSFREIRRLPPEAIERMEVYPEEVAVSQGYKPDQRVVNFVLKKNFRSITAEAEYGTPTSGGYSAQEFELGLLKLETNGRLQLNAEVNRSSPLYASERNLTVDTDKLLPPGTTAADFDTLRSKQLNVQLEGTYQRYLTDDISGTLNLTYEIANSDGASGPSGYGYWVTPGTVCDSPSALLCDGELNTISRTRTFHAGTGFNGDIGRWRWNFTANHDRTNTTNRNDNIPSDDPDDDVLLTYQNISKGQDVSTDATAVFNGPLAALPAGDIRASVTTGFVARDYEGWSERARDGFTQSALDRQEGNVLASLDIPIASARDDVLPFLGRLSLNTNAGYTKISDFGSLTSWGAGLNWGPSERLNLSASIAIDESAPSMSQLGSPLVETPNRSVYDFATGQTVLINSISGGNADLLSQKKREWKLGMSYELPWVDGLRFSADYYNNHLDDPIGSLPLLTAEVEAAFPDRVVRDAAGNLIAVDYRPLNYETSDNSNVRYGFTFFKSFGQQQRGRGEGGGGGRGASADAGGEGGPPPGAGRGGRGGPGPGGMMGGRGGGAGGRWNLSLFHSIKLTDTINIGPGLPQLDLLDGGATGSSGGSSRHTVDLDGGWSFKGIGFRGNAKYQSGTTVYGSDSADTLNFGDQFTFNLTSFVNFDQQPKMVEVVPFLKGGRLRLSVQNVFDSVQKVTNSAGDVPIAYQPAYLDPRGRYVEIAFRKMF